MTHLACLTGRLDPVAAAMAPLQSTRKQAWGGGEVGSKQDSLQLGSVGVGVTWDPTDDYAPVR